MNERYGTSVSKMSAAFMVIAGTLATIMEHDRWALLFLFGSISVLLECIVNLLKSMRDGD